MNIYTALTLLISTLLLVPPIGPIQPEARRNGNPFMQSFKVHLLVTKQDQKGYRIDLKEQAENI